MLLRKNRWDHHSYRATNCENDKYEAVQGKGYPIYGHSCEGPFELRRFYRSQNIESISVVEAAAQRTRDRLVNVGCVTLSHFISSIGSLRFYLTMRKSWLYASDYCFCIRQLLLTSCTISSSQRIFPNQPVRKWLNLHGNGLVLDRFDMFITINDIINEILTK